MKRRINYQQTNYEILEHKFLFLSFLLLVSAFLSPIAQSKEREQRDEEMEKGKWEKEIRKLERRIQKLMTSDRITAYLGIYTWKEKPLSLSLAVS